MGVLKAYSAQHKQQGSPLHLVDRVHTKGKQHVWGQFGRIKKTPKILVDLIIIINKIFDFAGERNNIRNTLEKNRKRRMGC